MKTPRHSIAVVLYLLAITCAPFRAAAQKVNSTVPIVPRIGAVSSALTPSSSVSGLATTLNGSLSAPSIDEASIVPAPLAAAPTMITQHISAVTPITAQTASEIRDAKASALDALFIGTQAKLSLAEILQGIRVELGRKDARDDNEFYRHQGNEHVKITSPGMKQAIYQSVDTDMRPAHPVSVKLPLFGTYNGRIDNAHDRVKLIMDGGIPEYVAVPREHLTTLRGPYGDSRVFQALTTRGSFDFARGEPIRFRDESSGLMRMGTYEEIANLGKKGKKAAILDENGLRMLLPKNLIYKHIGGRPYTPQYNIQDHGLWAPFNPRRNSLTGSFLHAAARFTSHPEFLAAGEPLRLKRVSDFVQTIVTPDMAASHGELHGFWNFDSVLAIGIGVCRHLATLVGAVLAEAGFDVKLAVYTAPGENVGHAWLEITLSNGEKAVLDPMNGILVPWNVVEGKARVSAESLEALFYAQPDRTLI